jgi:hypothetical protein
VVYAASDLFGDDVKAVLNATNAFASVHRFNAALGTPTLAQLQAHDAVLAFSNDEWQNATALGDRMADYFDKGGNAVLAVFAIVDTLQLGGRWASDGYDLIPAAGQNSTAETAALKILDRGSSLVSGAARLTAEEGNWSTGTVKAPDVVVATWGSGTPLIVRGMRNHRKIVALNFFTPSNRVLGSAVQPAGWDINTDGAAIMRNALLY